MRDLVAEQHAHDAPLHVARDRRVDGRVAQRREQPQHADVPGRQDAAVDESIEGARVDRVGAARGALHPEPGVALLRRGDVGQREVAHAIAEGRGEDDPLHLVVQIKGRRLEDAKEKKATIETYRIPGVNNLGAFGRWAFADFTDVWEIQSGFKAAVETVFNQ